MLSDTKQASPERRRLSVDRAQDRWTFFWHKHWYWTDGKKVNKFGQGPSPFFGQCPKEINFFYVRSSLFEIGELFFDPPHYRNWWRHVCEFSAKSWTGRKSRNCHSDIWPLKWKTGWARIAIFRVKLSLVWKPASGGKRGHRFCKTAICRSTLPKSHAGSNTNTKNSQIKPLWNWISS